MRHLHVDDEMLLELDLAEAELRAARERCHATLQSLSRSAQRCAELRKALGGSGSRGRSPTGRAQPTSAGDVDLTTQNKQRGVK
jgi:hypothetical protein